MARGGESLEAGKPSTGQHRVADRLGAIDGAEKGAASPVERPLYYAKGTRVFKRPISKDNADGSTSITIGFPVCEVSEYLDGNAAETLAALMNLGDAAPEMMAAIEALLDDKSTTYAVRALRARAALSKAKGSA